ncbi:target of Nesh-SH3 isoform X1 [Danio aesculapii]|uniref:target of Nesh-SH3 isoform X1 n=1 Tax=Danio aesculapii TaxID=1142201 RepID=UPI0024BF52EA|nr:target of Nesh-SH3 isoform X1 [Danio aesculapii]
MNSVLFSSRKGDNMQVFLLLLFLSKIFLLRLTSATTLKVPTQNMRVRISAVGDTVVFKFIRPHVDSTLRGYILGYGSSMFSKQFIQLPEDGQPYETEIDAEPKYLLAIQSNKPEEPKKQCAGKVDLEVPLNVVIGSVTESSVLLSWGTLLTSPFTDSIVDDCFDEGHFTVRYREQEPSNTWNYQTCPSSSTVIDNLKPDALYEFGVRAETDSKCGAWSPPVIHNTDDQIIRPFKELNQAKPKKPILADQKPFLPPVPLLNNITRAAPLLELPKPWKNPVSTPETTSTVQSQSPTNDPSTTQPDLFTDQHTSTTPQQPATIQPQPSTTQQQTSTTPPTTQEYIKTQISTKDPPYTTKQQFSETTTPILTTSPIPTTTKPQHTTTKEPDTTTQENLYTRKTQPRNKMQRLRPFRFRGTSKHQTTHTYPLPKTTSYYQSSTVMLSENTKPPTTTQSWSTNSFSVTDTALISTTTLTNIQDDITSQQTTDVSRQPVFSTTASTYTKYMIFHIPTTEDPPLNKSVQELTRQPVYLPITFGYNPQSSTTTQQSNTPKQQASTAKFILKQHILDESQSHNPEEWLPGTQKPQLNQTAFIKFDAIQNSPVTEKVTVRTSQQGQPTASSQQKDKRVLSQPTLTNEVAGRNKGRGIFRNSSSVSYPLARNVTQRLRPLSTNHLKLPPVPRNSIPNKKRGPHGEGHIGLHGNKPRKQPVKPKLNQVSDTKEKEIITDLKQIDPVPELKPLPPPTTEKPANQELSPTITPQSAFEGSRFDTGDNSSVYSNYPRLELDSTGKKRFVAPHVVYRTDKRPEEPCSVTNSLSFFPDEEVGYLNVTGPPKTPPSNLTVVTVEGCSSFVILDWDKTDNETTEYEVVSSTKGPHGEEVSIQTTNQTHTAVENLKPESSYEFKVTPKNELGSGPSSDPVSFSTESADPRVSEKTSKNAIWSSFPFKADSYTECNGRQFIKRTWYRKFVGIQLCNSLRYKIYLSDSLNGKFYSIGDQTGFGEDHCQFVDSFLDGRTGGPLSPDQLPAKKGFYRAMRQEPVQFGEMGGNSMINYVAWYECGIPIPGKW